MHITVGLLIVLIAAIVILSVGIQSLDQAMKMSHRVGSMDIFSPLDWTQRVIGAISIVLARLFIRIVMLRPRLGQSGG